MRCLPGSKTDADMKIDHIGIAVRDLEAAIATYEALLQTPCYKREMVETEKVETAFFRTGESKVELLGATTPESVIATYLEKRGPGLHHIAFEVADVNAELERLTALGFTALTAKPKLGADNKLIAFLHPKSAEGVLVELCQSLV
jgi:methylmalonyl-CoA/ethylmalonyl-CoA epimerase